MEIARSAKELQMETLSSKPTITSPANVNLLVDVFLLAVKFNPGNIYRKEKQNEKDNLSNCADSCVDASSVRLQSECADSR